VRVTFPRAAVSIAAVATLVLSACSSSGGGTPPSTGPSVDAGLTQSQAEQALLSQSDVGNGLQVKPTNPVNTPFPCAPDAPPLDAQVHPPVHAEVTFTDDLQSIELTEEINNYGDDATVAKALKIGEAGLACKSGSVGRFNVTVSGPSDLKAKITADVDKAEAWAVHSGVANESIIVAKIGTQLVVLTFGVFANANAQGLDAAGITQKALAKVRNAG
jgi:hypothetical protein